MSARLGRVLVALGLSLLVVFLGDAASYAAEPTEPPAPLSCTDEAPCIVRVSPQYEAVGLLAVGTVVMFVTAAWVVLIGQGD